MKLPRLLAFAVIACALGTTASAQEKVDPAKLLGLWEVTKGDPSSAREGCLFDFGKDGKLVFTLKVKDKQAKFDMTYTLTGDKMTAIAKGDKGDGRKMTIKKLDDKQLVWEEENGKTIELTRKK